MMMSLSETEAATSCYHCITTQPWSKQKCAKSSIKTGCTFCTKASFGASLFIRTCAKASTEKSYTDPKKTCKTYKTVYAGLKAGDAFKKNWDAQKRRFDQSCVATKNKEPFKAFTCKKKNCNSAPTQQSLSSTLILGVIAVVGTHFFRCQH